MVWSWSQGVKRHFDHSLVIGFDVIWLGRRLAIGINDQCYYQLFHCSVIDGLYHNNSSIVPDPTIIPDPPEADAIGESTPPKEPNRGSWPTETTRGRGLLEAVGAVSRLDDKEAGRLGEHVPVDPARMGVTLVWCFIVVSLNCNIFVMCFIRP